MELAGRDALDGSVGVSVDIERAHAADAFAAVVVEDDGLFVLLYELLVEHVEHFEEAAVGRNIVKMVGGKAAFFFGTALTPDFQIYADSFFHNQ